MKRLFVQVLLSLSVLIVSSARAQAQGELGRALDALASDSHTEISQGITALGNSSDESALTILAALDDGQLIKDSAGVLFIERDGAYLRPSGLTAASPQGARSAISLNNSSRRALQAALAKLRLSSKNTEVRRAAATKLAEHPDAEAILVIRSLIDAEKDEDTRGAMALALAKVDIGSEDKQLRLAAIQAILDSSDISMEAELKQRIAKGPDGKYLEPDAEARAKLRQALQAVQGRIFWINTVANTIYGLSLGSVLVLAALGLAITFGLMRVINMAHGEVLMLGAYSTFFVREFLLSNAPDLSEHYLLFAVPFAFAITFGVGVILERLVIRHLYGRPLETLLATWGLSLILIQSIRLTFGAQNVTVANPELLSGGFELMPALVVPYSRIAVLLFSASVVLFVAFVLRGTSVGLKVRAVTQNREIAAGLGIATHRVDMWTFGLGSGLAGLGGVALSQLGNVGPELGQQHIIDSFMVVVLGGVGNILGTVLAGVGLGIANKILEPSVGAVLGKIMLLALLILFIQYRPQGLFALKGRAAES